MTTHQFPTGEIIKHDNYFFKILGEAGEVRFISYGWRKDGANKKDGKGLKDSNHIFNPPYTIHQLNAYGYVPVSPEESGLVEEWCPKDKDGFWFVEETPHYHIFDANSSWHRVLLKSGLLKRTKEEAERAYKELMGE